MPSHLSTPYQEPPPKKLGEEFHPVPVSPAVWSDALTRLIRRPSSEIPRASSNHRAEIQLLTQLPLPPRKGSSFQGGKGFSRKISELCGRTAIYPSQSRPRLDFRLGKYLHSVPGGLFVVYIRWSLIYATDSSATFHRLVRTIRGKHKWSTICALNSNASFQQSAGGLFRGINGDTIGVTKVCATGAINLKLFPETLFPQNPRRRAVQVCTRSDCFQSSVRRKKIHKGDGQFGGMLYLVSGRHQEGRLNSTLLTNYPDRNDTKLHYEVSKGEAADAFHLGGGFQGRGGRCLSSRGVWGGIIGGSCCIISFQVSRASDLNQKRDAQNAFVRPSRPIRSQSNAAASVGSFEVDTGINQTFSLQAGISI
ncbi:hypothetical protein CEXT_249301 [Caerostris extrusa]|uniref:Uncharacterized protein n=1 Tax=Caerostris extrusa TaxID=172846 RepID=A0AAV4SK55_CAEEX|nr:hypothetical protein CEXT_249301 [Caerostris extrusa]